MRMGGQVLTALNEAAALAPFNGVTTVNDKSVGPGGIINIALTSQNRQNLKNFVSNAAVQFIRCDIEYKFAGTSVSTSVEPDRQDHIHFGVNNNGYRTSGGGSFTPSKANLYRVVKDIFHPTTNAGVTADDANNELDVSGGGETNLLIDDPASPIAASAANLDKILNRAGRLYRNTPLHYTDPTATYRDFAATDLPAGHTWGGAIQINPSPSSVPDNRVIYTIPGGEFERKITTGGRAVWVIYDQPNWRGPATDNSDADSKVRAAGDVVFFGGKVQCGRHLHGTHSPTDSSGVP